MCFPGLFRGLLDARARSVDDTVKLAAARAIAAIATPQQLGPDHVIPSLFDRTVVPAAAAPSPSRIPSRATATWHHPPWRVLATEK